MTRTRVNASSSSFHYGFCTLSRQVKLVGDRRCLVAEEIDVHAVTRDGERNGAARCAPG